MIMTLLSNLLVVAAGEREEKGEGEGQTEEKEEEQGQRDINHSGP